MLNARKQTPNNEVYYHCKIAPKEAREAPSLASFKTQKDKTDNAAR